MNWLNLETRWFGAPEYVGARPVQRATWVTLLAWCAEQENGGRIVGARLWGDTRWQQTCRVKRCEVLGSAPLVTVEGDDVVVWNYPVDAERVQAAKRAGGRSRAAARWGAGEQEQGEEGESPLPGASGSGDRSPMATPVGSAGGSADAKGRGKEGKTPSPSGEAPSLAVVRLGVPPSEAEWVEWWLGRLADKGAALPLREYLLKRWSDFAAVGWMKGSRRIENWRALEGTLRAQYENDYGEETERRRAGVGGENKRVGAGNPRVGGTLNAGADYAGVGPVVGGRAGRGGGGGAA